MPEIKDIESIDLAKELISRSDQDVFLDLLEDHEIQDEFDSRGIECDCPECDEQHWPEDVYDNEVENAYRAMDASTPEPIRHLILALAGRIV
jgi:hypothetical protein